MDKFENILKKIESVGYYGEIFLKYSDELNAFSKTNSFINNLEEKLNRAIIENNIKRFDFIAFLLASIGNNSIDYQSIYFLMIDFILDTFAKNNTTEFENDEILAVVLDLFWHQDNALRNLNRLQQIKFNLFLKLVANYKYEISKDGDEIFFAINKSIDLIRFQKTYGDTKSLSNLYINHFDEKIRQTATEKIIKTGYNTG